MRIVAFNNDPQLKQRFLFRIGAHEDLFVRFVDLRLRDIHRKKLHVEYLAPVLQKDLGLPLDLTHLMHAILQHMPRNHVHIFRDQLIAAINPGADLSFAAAQFIHWLLTDHAGPRHGLLEDDLYYLDSEAEIYARYLSGKPVTYGEWQGAVMGADLAIWLAEEERRSNNLYYFARYAVQAPHSGYATAQTAIRAARVTSPDYWGVMNYKLCEILTSIKSA